ncbi:GH25 family lysozyme [Enterococcus alishanensis]
MKPLIIDISEWQVPAKMNYAALAKQIDHVIVRIQYGSAYLDKHYVSHIKNFQACGIPVAVYAFVRGINHHDMEHEAQTFYQRAKEFQPTFYWLDVEEVTMADMRGGVEAFRRKLKDLTGAKVGAYIGHHLYKQLNLVTENFDGIWLPTYGRDTGTYQGVNPSVTQRYDLHQYTSRGRLNGYNGDLDLNRLTGQKNLNYFTGEPLKDLQWGISEPGHFKLHSAIHLRCAPTTNALKIATLKAGEVLKYDAFAHENGYVWLRQIRQDGTFGYLATGKSDGQKRTEAPWGTFF